MTDLSAQLESCFRSRVCLLGLGNTDCGDDALGVRLAEQLAAAGVADVIVAGSSPERVVGRVAAAGYDHVIFLDAVEFGGAPGSVVWLGADEIAARFPQISTHRISLGLLARWIEERGATRAWLLGVQPASLRPGTSITPAVQTTVDLLVELIADLGLSTSANVGAAPLGSPKPTGEGGSSCRSCIPDGSSCAVRAPRLQDWASFESVGATPPSRGDPPTGFSHLDFPDPAKPPRGFAFGPPALGARAGGLPAESTAKLADPFDRNAGGPCGPEVTA